jgi:NADPH:quinone reductase-like Zn-dependent oxidoreductase
MRAVQFTSFGGPEVLHVETVPMPVPADGELLVKVHAAGVNPHDLLNRSGSLRVITGRHFPFGTGLEFAGEVVKDKHGTFPLGQKVWGSVPAMKPHATGAIAEYVAVPIDRIARLPESLTFVEGASLVITATTAIRALRQEAKLQPGESILVRGAGGGVGLAAVQIAVAVGALVTTLSSNGDFAALTTLGATQTLDYKTIQSKDLGRFDVIFDAVGTHLLAYRSHLDHGGRMVTIAFASGRALAEVGLSSIFGRHRIRVFSTDAKSDLLDAAVEMVDRGQLRPTVASTFSLEDTGRAQEDLNVGGRRGKRVIVV